MVIRVGRYSLQLTLCNLRLICKLKIVLMHLQEPRDHSCPRLLLAAALVLSFVSRATPFREHRVIAQQNVRRIINV